MSFIASLFLAVSSGLLFQPESRFIHSTSRRTHSRCVGMDRWAVENSTIPSFPCGYGRNAEAAKEGKKNSAARQQKPPATVLTASCVWFIICPYFCEFPFYYNQNRGKIKKITAHPCRMSAGGVCLFTEGTKKNQQGCTNAGGHYQARYS